MEQLRFNPFKNKSIDLRKAYPELAKAWLSSKLSDIALHYICIMYDPNSPCKLYPGDRVEHKKYAAIFCGWPTEGVTFAEPYISYLSGQSFDFNKAIILFVKLFGSASYMHLVNLFMAYDDICLTLADPTKMAEQSSDDDRKQKTPLELAKIRAETMSKANALYINIKSAEQEFLGEKDPAINRALYKLVSEEIKSLPISPEGRLKIR